VKIFVIPVPPTPKHSTAHPDLPSKYTTPVALTEGGSAGGIQTLPNGRLVFSRSSLTSPHDVFIFRGLKHLEDSIEADHEKTPAVFTGQLEQVTHFTEDVLKAKNLDAGEEFWFKGANDNDVQGWVLKPKGFKVGEKKRWPVVLLIHGGVCLDSHLARKSMICG
jgi:dipeptidyl aminopeptidase/acylaminoacyl peptidase